MTGAAGTCSVTERCDIAPTMTRMLSGTFCGRDAEKDSRALGSLDAQHPLDQFGVDRS